MELESSPSEFSDPRLSPTNPQISLICPVFNEDETLPNFVEQVMADLTDSSFSFELLFVDDGSADRSWQVIVDLANKHPNIRGLRLARNVGKEAALVAGLEHARGDAHIPIDVDLQDPPHLIPLLVDKWHEGALHVVARRSSRGDSLLRNASSSLYYTFSNWLTAGAMQRNVGDFRLLDKSKSEQFLLFREKRRVNKEIFALLGSQPEEVNFVRPRSSRTAPPRQSVAKLLDLTLVTLAGSSRRLARLGLLLGFSGLLLTLATGLVVTILWANDFLDVPGQATTIMVALVIVAAQVGATSVIVLVLSEILDEVKGRPLFIKAEEIP